MLVKLKDVINEIEQLEAERIASEYAQFQDFTWGLGIEKVFRSMFRYHFVIPNLKVKAGTEEILIQKWVKKYIDGYNGRPSIRVSNPPGTTPDGMIDTIIRARLSNIDDNEVEKIKYAHRLSMSAENILGLFLEEYISHELGPYGWFCAWGATLDKIDFFVPQNTNSPFFQFKNRSNTENSSSSTVREGTTIQKWHRINAQTGRTYWEDLNQIANSSLNNDQAVHLSEQSFIAFVQDAITSNMNCIPLDNDSPYLSETS
jgi:hypothetical protein